MNIDDLSQKISESKPLEFGNVFNNSLELFKKVWLEGFVIVILTFVSILPFYILLYVPMLAFGIADPEAFQNEEMPPAAALFMLLFMPVFLLGVMVCSLCLNAGFLRICWLKDLNQPVDGYFFYFKKEYLVKALSLSLIMFGLSILGFLACGLGMFYLIVPLSLFPVFLAFDKELSAMDITKASFALGNKNWGVIFGLLLLMGVIGQLGVLLCFVGVFFTAMISKVPAYFVYKEAVGFPSRL
ncbi:hypothetical protein LV716_10640 [Flagellimonas sp. HMM57]|uniref:hypothetical protein n=1 Tax=unclassified Flagellimonas TaxID=2644544 RepID=UPI0013D6FF58|nr:MULTISPECIES: hypothetical protein [unclassified Flagellimonas]UII74723.1 hypothetical protein LV716_10640 [Flagellimonas sp. HMM57]